MPDPSPGTVPTFLAPLIALSEEKRVEALERVHPDVSDQRATWQALLDAFEGSGGFADGMYLWPYPREAEGEFTKRQKRARYHNYLETLVDLYVRFIFTQGVKRKSQSTEYDAWLEDVDGAGTAINDFLKRAAAQALASGHAGILVDKTPDAPSGPTKAEETSRPIACIFPPTAIADWRFTGPTLSAVKLLEAAPEPSIVDDPLGEAESTQYLLWDTEGWGRFRHDGLVVGTGVTSLGLVPLAILRPKPRHTHPIIGRALVSNANVLKALYNRDSEEDNVLRDQAFSVLTVSVPPDGDVDRAKEDLGSEVGTTRALVVRGEVSYQTPDQAVPTSIRENRAYLAREVYRAAHIRFQRDGLSAESGESIRLQHSELNEMLQGFAKSLAEVERHMARAYFAWTTPTVEAGIAAYDAAQIEVEYPTEFFYDDLLHEITAMAEALRLNLGPTMSRRIKKKAARRVDPDTPPDQLDVIDQEIDAQDEQTLSGVIPFPMDRGQPDELEEAPDAVA